MGKKIKFTSDPKLAKSHDAGTVVELTQPLLHNQFGVIHFITPQFYPYHFNRAEKSFRELEEFQDKVLKLPVNRDNSRMISDLEFIGEIYNAGFDMIVHLHVGFEHFLLDILKNAIKDKQGIKQFNKANVITKLRYILKNVIDRKDLINSSGYSDFAEIEIIRHALNHPTTRRIYNGNLNQWDEVPLAWIISGKYKKAYKGARGLFDELHTVWESEKKKYEIPGRLTNVKRGIKSLHPVKK